MLRSFTAGPKAKRPKQGRDVEGFTLVELTVAMSIMVIVMLCFLSVLQPGSKASSEAQDMITNEQDVTLALNDLQTDVRAANPLDVFDSSVCASYSNTTYDDQIEMVLGPSDSTQQTVLWI